MSHYILKKKPLSSIKTLYEQLKSDWEYTQLSGDLFLQQRWEIAKLGIRLTSTELWDSSSIWIKLIEITKSNYQRSWICWICNREHPPYPFGSKFLIHNESFFARVPLKARAIQHLEFERSCNKFETWKISRWEAYFLCVVWILVDWRKSFKN